ncbi:MAG TPA: molybdopterin-dependent oxidoreductase [Thermoleophilaceae bacterium]
MILEQFYLGCLSHASYLVGDEASGAAAVIDPQRDVDTYVERARELGLRIEHVLLTHFHADFVAGHLELRDRTDAHIYLGARAAAEYEFIALADGDRVELGRGVRLEVAETPGHSPESISIVVYDLAREGGRPHAVLTGDTLFIGDVGRPDLRASLGWTAEDLGGLLYDSLHGRLLSLPDDTLVYPAHGAGSLCGKNLSSDTVSTIGRQRQENYALKPMTREEFVEVVTAEQPDAPAYFSYDAWLNTTEHPTLEQTLELVLRPLTLGQALAVEQVQILDVRRPAQFAAAHLLGSINVGLEGTYATWAGTLLDRERPIVLLADPGREREAAMRLGRIGFDNVAGYLAGGARVLDRHPELVGRFERIGPTALAEELASDDPPALLDVRSESEWDESRIEGGVNIPLSHLPERLAELPRDRRLVVHCSSGFRSTIAASLLHGQGFDQLADLAGGLDAWAPKHPALLIRTRSPLNAETPLDLLCRSTVTPTELLFVRTHGPVPEVDPATYRLRLDGLVRQPSELSLEDLLQFERVEVPAALMCAGNRRSDLASLAPIPGEVQWADGVVGNALWGGVRLRDVLLAAGLETDVGHVAFTGLDRCVENGEQTLFGGSIPLQTALNPSVLIADELNGRQLPAIHGYPLRIVAPGTIGARSVKWLASVTVQRESSSNYFQDAYSLRSTPGDRGFELSELPVNSVTCEVKDGVARGYALTGGQRRVERVEVSLDGGATWQRADLIGDGRPGSWQLWEARLGDTGGASELVVRAFDSAAATQPEDLAGLWNVKGYLNNAWHRLPLRQPRS